MSDITVTTGDGISVEIVASPAPSITVTEKGPKGDTGATGATGSTGATGPGVIAGGTANEFLQKNSATDYDTKWSAYTLPGVDGVDGQVLTTDGAGTVSFAYPKTISEDVKNVSGGPLSKGTPVHVTGSVGNLAEVIAADAATNYPAHFVLDEDLADEGEGKGIALGFINNVDVPDASIYTEGQTVYLGETAGTFTTTKPTGTNAIQNLGIIIKVNTGGNKISGIVMGAGRSNDVPNIPNGQAWIGNASGVATPTTLATVATSGDYDDLSNKPTRGGTYSYSGYATDVTKTATFYYQFPSATATSSSTDMISGFVGQAISHGTYGANGSMTLDGLSSTDSATYSMTVKVTTNGTIIIGTLSPSSGQFTAANQIVTSSASEQTFTLTQTSPTSCLSEGGKHWVLRLQVTFFGATSVDFRVEDLSITVS